MNMSSSGRISRGDTEKSSFEQNQKKVDIEQAQVSPQKEHGKLQENSMNSSSLQTHLSVETNFTIHEQRKSFGNVGQEDAYTVEKDERKEDNLDLDLLSAKTGSSLLKEHLPTDVFVPGNQKIIRKRKENFEKDPVKIINKTNKRISHKRGNLNRMNQSMIRLPETFVEKFEKEDYEAARPLGVDEFIKNFLVSENPSADQYSVPLTKLAPQPQVSNAFYLNILQSTSPYGKPKIIKVRILLSII